MGLMGITRKPTATYAIPSEDEWYKSAYYKSGGTNAGYWTYATKGDVVPINTLIYPDPGNHANFFDAAHTGNGNFTIGSPYYRTEVGAFANSSGPYGTFDQCGNVWQWNEATVSSRDRGESGGSFFDSPPEYLSASNRGYLPPSYERSNFGFVADVPEPSTITLLVCGAVGLFTYAWRRRQR